MYLICGMHRSGTSLVARLAAMAGGDFGDPAGFYPADEWNPAGYYEQEEVIRANTHLINGPWGRLSYAALPSEATLVRRGQKQADAIRGLVERHQCHIVKENRFCITLPVWRYFGADIRKITVVFRDPGSVARSLKRRNKLPLAVGALLWHEHYRRLLGSIDGADAMYLWYDRLVSGRAAAIEETRRLLGFLELDEGRAETAVDECIDFSDDARQRPEAPRLPRFERVETMFRDLIAMQSG